MLYFFKVNQFNKNGITIVEVENQNEGEDFAKDFLYKNSDPATVLFLSGGKTPKAIYEQILLENKLSYGAIGMIDERYGLTGHQKSNALLMDKFSPFYPVLSGENIEKTSQDYDETVRYLFNYFQKSIGILGIGGDGHTAGIPAIPHIAEKILEDRFEYVTFFDAKDGFYDKRITLTFNGLSRLDQILVLVFGEEKKYALKKMFKEGPVTEIPARFYLTPEMVGKTILVTDQNV